MIKEFVAVTRGDIASFQRVYTSVAFQVFGGWNGQNIKVLLWLYPFRIGFNKREKM